MKIQVLKYNQNGQEFISTVLTAGVLIKISKVLTYNRDPEGYQRDANKAHYNKIKKYIIENQNSFILPTSIILGVDRNLIEPSLITEGGVNFLNIDESSKIFRIVDGQHRIEGIKKAIEEKGEIEDLQLPITIVLSDERRRSIELEIFSDINSKAKRINTDLAQLAKFNFEVLEESIVDINKHISIKTAYELKEKKEGIWANAIKFNIQSDFNIGIIGIAMFSDSLSKIVDLYTNTVDKPALSNKLLTIEYCNNCAVFLGNFLDELWSDIIFKKWNSAFTNEISLNEFGEVINSFYSNKHYIQKGIGTNSIHSFFSEVISLHGFNEKSKKVIKEKIVGSKIKSEDWANGGPFSGYNSGSGFNKIKKILISSDSIV